MRVSARRHTAHPAAAYQQRLQGFLRFFHFRVSSLSLLPPEI